MTDPYRSSSPRPCPGCAQPLDASQATLICERGCGEWLTGDHESVRATRLAEEFGEVLSFEGFKDPTATCPDCRSVLIGRIWANAVFRLCSRHGIWLEEWARARFHTQVAADSPRERAVDELAQRLTTDEGRRELARRLLALEHRVELLEKK